MKRYVLAVCAMLVLAGGAAHAIPFDRIPLISNTLGDVQNRLCAGAATPAGQADIACPSYSPYVTSGGLLGVGTSSPTATLQVSGSFIVSTTGQTSSPSLYVGTNGYVGIGTATPNAKLQVSGSFIVSTSAQTTTPSLYVSTSGNVGVGTLTPTVPLEVSGTVSATHFVGDGSGLTGVTAASSDRITSGTTQMVVVSNTGFVSLTQASTNTGWFDPTRGLVTLGVSATGPISGTGGYFSGNVGVNKQPSTTVEMDISGTLNVTSNINKAALSLSAPNANTAPVLSISGYSSTGIYDGKAFGVSAPGDSMSRFVVFTDGKVGFGNGSSERDIWLQRYAASVLRLSSDAGNGAADLLVNGKVGIATTAPSRTLHISGTALTTSWTGINFSSAGNVTPTAPLEVSGTVSATHFVGDGSGLTGVTAASSDRITSGTTQMVVVSNTGYVSLTQAGTNTGWFNPTRGLVTLGVSATGGLSGTTGYFASSVSTTSVYATNISGSVGTVDRLGAGSFQSSYISGTLIQPGASASTCVAAINGAIRYNSTSSTIDVCIGTSWTSLSSSTTSALPDRITSGTTNVTANSATATISFTTNGSVANYFNSAGDLVAHGISLTTNPLSASTVNAANISATAGTIDSLGVYNLQSFNVSSTLIQIQPGASGVACSAGINGALRYNNTSNTIDVCIGTSWGNISNALGDRIISGTTNVIATSGTATIGFTVGGSTLATMTTTGLSITTVRAGNISITAGTVDSLGVYNLQSTNISATMVDVTPNGTVSATYGYFGSISGSGAGLYDIPASAITGEVSGDRITSGTVSVIANQSTGVSVSAPLEVSGTISATNTVTNALQLTSGSSVTCDAAHLYTIIADPATGTMLICRP